MLAPNEESTFNPNPCSNKTECPGPSQNTIVSVRRVLESPSAKASEGKNQSSSRFFSFRLSVLFVPFRSGKTKVVCRVVVSFLDFTSANRVVVLLRSSSSTGYAVFGRDFQSCLAKREGKWKKSSIPGRKKIICT